jgi:hypothetical protein
MSCTTKNLKTNHLKNIVRVGRKSPYWFLLFSP